MEESLKYYVPEISDRRVGYECEYLIGGELGVWTKGFGLSSGGFPSIEEIKIFPKIVRTPYLTKEQIEAEGAIHVGGKLNLQSDQEYEYKGYEIIYKPLTNKLIIRHKNYIRDGSGNYDGYHNYFYGYCYSINEFRYITNKLLKIK